MAETPFRPQPPKKGAPVRANEIGATIRKAWRTIRGGPGILVKETGDALTISLARRQGGGGGKAKFLNPGFHVELAGEGEEGELIARLWGGQVEYQTGSPTFFVNGSSPVNGVDYQDFTDSFNSASAPTFNGMAIAKYDSENVLLDEFIEVSFDPSASFFVYVEIIQQPNNPIVTANLKTVASGSVPTDVGYDPYGTDDAKRHVTVARWDVAEQKLVIVRRGTLNHANIYGQATQF
jgi:hypothetical protein